jgi:hypothetical protein
MPLFHKMDTGSILRLFLMFLDMCVHVWEILCWELEISSLWLFMR